MTTHSFKDDLVCIALVGLVMFCAFVTTYVITLSVLTNLTDLPPELLFRRVIILR